MVAAAENEGFEPLGRERRRVVSEPRRFSPRRRLSGGAFGGLQVGG